MRRRPKIALSVGLITLLLVILWLASYSFPRHRPINVGLTMARGHFPEPGLIYADRITITWVTNTAGSAIKLETPRAQFEKAAGGLITDTGSSWNQQEYEADLLPGRVAWLAYGPVPNTTRFKVYFEYNQSAGSLLALVSRGVRLLPLKRFPQPTYDWLRKRGIVDGRLYRQYESTWIVNESMDRTQGSH